MPNQPVPTVVRGYLETIRPPVVSLDGFGQGGPAIRLLTHADGGRSVVKWIPARERSFAAVQESASLARVLVEAGWPFPAVREVTEIEGFTVIHEDFAPGRHPSDLTESTVRELLALSAASPVVRRPAADWPTTLLANLNGADPKIDPSVLATTALGRWLLTETAQALETPDLRTVDRAVIHGDFSPGNTLLSADGSLLAVVDRDGVTVGDPAFDLATLEWDLELWGRSVTSTTVGQALATTTSPAVRRAYRLYLTCRNLTWSTATPDEPRAVATARRMIAAD